MHHSNNWSDLPYRLESLPSGSDGARADFEGPALDDEVGDFAGTVRCSYGHCEADVLIFEFDEHMRVHEEEEAQQHQLELRLVSKRKTPSDFRTADSAAKLPRTNAADDDDASFVAPSKPRGDRPPTPPHLNAPPSGSVGAPSHGSPVIRNAHLIYKFLHASGSCAAKVYLCSPGIHHIRTDKFDWRWGCGYRNIQMLLSGLLAMDEFADEVRNCVRPYGDANNSRQPLSVPVLQETIERAWRQGFDPAGAAQLNGKVVGTRKWIGASEAVALFAFLGIRTTLLDFPKFTGPNKGHPALLDYVEAYFDGSLGSFYPLVRRGAYPAPFQRNRGAGVHLTGKAPLYFQHKGHSRTIIGIEVDGTRRSLLVLDPGRDLPLRLASSKFADPNAMGAETRLLQTMQTKPLVTSLRVTDKQLALHDQYQIVQVAAVGWASDAQRDAAKLLKSVRVE
ncbi:peptidase family C78-domain-containing protein [Zopfochytrium polystomum]|nr:peptidase family C78-domain-containing protein [Zopfochytrium polystomum]